MLRRNNNPVPCRAIPWNKTPIIAAGEICLEIVRRKTFQSTALPY
jgi:hypothetical protein